MEYIVQGGESFEGAEILKGQGEGRENDKGSNWGVR